GATVECYTINGTAIMNYRYGATANISFAVHESIVTTTTSILSTSTLSTSTLSTSTTSSTSTSSTTTSTTSTSTSVSSTSTTTTTPVPTTTTTSLVQTCANGGIPCGGPCGGACLGVCVWAGGSSCILQHCGSEQRVCVPAPVLVHNNCKSD